MLDLVWGGLYTVYFVILVLKLNVNLNFLELCFVAYTLEISKAWAKHVIILL